MTANESATGDQPVAERRGRLPEPEQTELALAQRAEELGLAHALNLRVEHPAAEVGYGTWTEAAAVDAAASVGGEISARQVGLQAL